jgi:cytochrome oxidase Cu insertion factor (SCO1/SenC/PrrC family)
MTRSRCAPALRRRALAAVLLAALVPASTGAAPLFEADPPRSFDLPVIREAGDFSVRDAETGALLRLSDFRGRAVVLSLFYASCADGNACPLATATLRAAQREIARRRLGGQVALLSVTFDEARDTVAVLRAERERAGAGPEWRFATPETAARREALLSGFDQRIARAPDGTIVHPLRVYLLDGRGRVRQIYSQSFLRADVLLNDVETVLADEGVSGDGASVAPPETLR